MADRPARAASAGDSGSTTPDVEEAPEDPKYDRDRLIAESGDFLGEPSHVVAGALAATKKKSLTLAEARTAIKAFLATEVS